MSCSPPALAGFCGAKAGCQLPHCIIGNDADCSNQKYGTCNVCSRSPLSRLPREGWRLFCHHEWRLHPLISFDCAPSASTMYDEPFRRVGVPKGSSTIADARLHHSHLPAPHPRSMTDRACHTRQKGGPNQQWLSWLCTYTLSMGVKLTPPVLSDQFRAEEVSFAPGGACPELVG